MSYIRGRSGKRVRIRQKLGAGETRSEREYIFLKEHALPGIIRPVSYQFRTIIYKGTGGIPLSVYFEKPISRQDYFNLIAGLLQITQTLRENALFLQNLVLDLQDIFIKEETKTLQFLYEPISGHHVCVDLCGFVEELTYAAKLLPVESGDADYAGRFLAFLQEHGTWKPDRVRTYLEKEQGQQTAETGKEGTTLLEEEGTTLLEEEGTQLLEEEETTLLEEIRYSSLLRIRTQEEILLDKPVFRIGKERSYVDYFVSDNQAVSRSHADIITREGHCFLVDNHSTNKTFINGIVIPVGQRAELHDQDLICLGNEEFRFQEEGSLQ